jgi:hypothetical protein
LDDLGLYPLYQWPFQEPKLEVPTIYKALYIYKAYVREYPSKIWPYMVQYLRFRILKFPLILGNLNMLIPWNPHPNFPKFWKFSAFITQNGAKVHLTKWKPR